MCERSIETNLASVASAIADTSRATMLCVLMDGRAHTATELAVCADIAPSTASGHLQRLLDNGLVRRLSQGRHRYYALSGKDVASMLETLLTMPPPQMPPCRTPQALRLARSCYDHTAGAVAVAIHDRMLELGWLDEAGNGYQITPRGIDGLVGLGVETAAPAGTRRFAFACLDWSERRPHIGGWLGARLMDRLLERGWLQRQADSRALSVSAAGERGLSRTLGVVVAGRHDALATTTATSRRQPAR